MLKKVHLLRCRAHAALRRTGEYASDPPPVGPRASRSALHMVGKLTVVGANPLPGGIPNSVTADVEPPDVFSIGLSHQFTPEVRVLADWTWTGWSSIPTLDIAREDGSALSSVPLQFQETWRAGLGMNYKMNEKWTLRLGMAYDKAPVQDEYRTPRLPDDSRIWAAGGFQWKLSQKVGFIAGSSDERTSACGWSVRQILTLKYTSGTSPIAKTARGCPSCPSINIWWSSSTPN